MCTTIETCEFSLRLVIFDAEKWTESGRIPDGIHTCLDSYNRSDHYQISRMRTVLNILNNVLNKPEHTSKRILPGVVSKGVKKLFPLLLNVEAFEVYIIFNEQVKRYSVGVWLDKMYVNSIVFVTEFLIHKTIHLECSQVVLSRAHILNANFLLTRISFIILKGFIISSLDQVNIFTPVEGEGVSVVCKGAHVPDSTSWVLGRTRKICVDNEYKYYQYPIEH